MKQILKLFTYVDGVNDKPFPSAEEQAILTTYKAEIPRMGGAGYIEGKVMHRLCLDNLWSAKVYAVFMGERYTVKSTASSTKDSSDTKYQHDLVLRAENEILSHIYFIDAIQGSPEVDKVKTNSDKVQFCGDINEFISRLNASLTQANTGYKAVVNEGISSEDKFVSFEKKYITEALQEIYNVYELPYYFKGKEIHVGYEENAITTPMAYGHDDALVSISKTNANYKVVNRCSALGSTENLPYYYPNKTAKGIPTLKTTAVEGSPFTDDDIEIEDIVLFAEKADATDVYKAKYGTDLNAAEIVEVLAKYNDEGQYIKADNGIKYIPLKHSEINSTASVKHRIEVKVKKECRLVLVQEMTHNPVEPSYPFLTTSKKTITYAINGGTPMEYTVGSDSLFTIEAKELGTYIILYRQDIIVSNIGSIKPQSVGVSSAFNTDYTQVLSWYNKNKIVRLDNIGLSLRSMDNVREGDSFQQIIGEIIPFSEHLMPPIYRQSKGKERFYNAKNNIYPLPESKDGYYMFENEYSDVNPDEIIFDADDIKPTIKGMTNTNQERIDMFSDFAFDKDDNDDKDAEGNYIHPYFFAKMKKTNGSSEFNLFRQSNEKQPMQISFTSGVCGGCSFEIGVGEETNKNIVQVDENGNLKYDEKGRVLWRNQKPQDRQNDTSNYETWIALKKDIETYSHIMPNASRNFKPSTEDTFVILGINLPDAYIYAAEERLKEAIIKYMFENNREKFNFSIKFSRIFLKEHPEVLNKLNENARLLVRYNEREYTFYVDNFTYSVNETEPLPEIEVNLVDTLTIGKNSLQQMISGIKQEILYGSGGDFLKQGLKYFLRKDIDDYSNGRPTFLKGIKSNTDVEVGDFVDSIMSGRGSRLTDKELQTDSAIIRGSLTVMDYIINEIQAMSGSYEFTDYGKIESVKHISGDVYKLFLKQDTKYDITTIVENDIIVSIINDIKIGGSNYYTSWMRVITTNMNDNSVTIVLYPDTEVPTGKNYPPSEGYNVTRRGNVILPTEEKPINKRSQSWMLSSTEGRILFLTNVYKPILEDYNYAISIGNFPEIKALKNLPISKDDVGIMAKTIVCENLYQYDYNGDVISKKVDRGEWSLEVAQSEQPYRYVQHEAIYPDGVHTYTELEQHTVYHYGCKWGCLKDKTTNEPIWNSPDWVLLEGDKNYHLDFESSNGWQFFLKAVNTDISAIVYYGNRNITNALFEMQGTEIEWLRDTGNIPSDNTWKPTYVDEKRNVIRLTNADMGSGWGMDYRKISFICRVFIPNGKKYDTIENKINIKL